MKKNVLANRDIVKIYLCFKDGRKRLRREQVNLRVYDSKYCYLDGSFIFDFAKPGWFAKAEIIVYTKSGTYSATERIKAIDFSLEKVMYIIALPKEWNYTQSRSGERKEISIPATITFGDGVPLETEIISLAQGGFSIILKEDFTSLHTKFPCDISFALNKKILNMKAKYVRTQFILDDYELASYKKYSFKFINILPEQRSLLSSYLMTI